MQTPGHPVSLFGLGCYTLEYEQANAANCGLLKHFAVRTLLTPKGVSKVAV